MLTLKSLKTEVDDLREIVRMTDSKVTGVRQLVEAQAVSLVKLHDAVTGLQTEMRAGFARLDASVQSLTSDIQARELNAYDLNANMKAVRTDVTTLKVDVATLKSDVSTLKVDVATLKSDVSTLKVDVATLKSDVSTLKDDVKRIDGRLDGMDQRQDRMDQNVVAIMRHLGIEPVAA
jgi:chromosome segregation ATPase